MRQLSHISSIVFWLFLNSVSNAQSDASQPIYVYRTNEIGLVRHSTIEVVDEVGGGCWTNGSTLRSKAFLVFEQNGIAVPDYVPAFYGPATVSTSLSAFGFRTKAGLCVVSAEFAVETIVWSDLGGNGVQEYRFENKAELFSRASVFVSGNNSNDQLGDFFDGAASEFAAKVLVARRNEHVVKFYEDYPKFGQRPMSKAEWEKILSDSRTTSKN